MDTKIFLEKLATLGVKAKIKRDEEVIEVMLNEEGCFRAYIEEKHICYSLYRIKDKKIEFLCIDWLKHLANKENKQLVLERYFGKTNELVQLLEKNGYKEMEQLEKELYVLSSLAPKRMYESEKKARNRHHNGTYEYQGSIFLTEEYEKEIKKLLHLYTTVEEKLHDIFQKETFFFYEKNYNLFNFEYYAWGEKGEIEVTFEDKKMYLSITKENNSHVKKMHFSEAKDIEKILVNWAERMKRKQGIKQLFETNEGTFFFEKLMCSDDLVTYIPEHMKKKVHTCMLQFHTNEQLEEIASKYIKTKTFTIHGLPLNTYYFHFDQKVYFIDENRGKVYAYDNSPEIKKEIKMFLMNILENELNEKLNINS